MKKIYLPIALAIVAGSPLLAQNLNPEVQVTNDYVARMADVHKNGTPMSVPDSLTRFSTDIDYSVFTTAYQGAYEFSPYAITMEPEARGYDVSRLLLRVGAGYSFHPVVRAVFTPVPKGLLRNSEYLSFDGYGGRYRSLDGRAAFPGMITVWTPALSYAGTRKNSTFRPTQATTASTPPTTPSLRLTTKPGSD